MIPRLWPATAQRFVTLASEVANSLDFATVVREPRHPLAWRTETLGSLWWDLYAEGRKAGLSAIAMIEAGASLRDELAVAANAYDDGDLDPWLERRDRVRELLDELRVAGPQDEPVDGDRDVVVRSAVAFATPSRPTQASPPAIGSDTQDAAGGKGEKGEKHAIAPAARTANGRRILSMLLEHDAIQEEDRVTREYIADESRLTIEKVRRAIEQDLKPKGLIESKLGRDGGLWLAQAGIAAAQSLAAK